MAADQNPDNYWIRAKPDSVIDPTFTDGKNSAILRYAGAPVADPNTTSTTNLPLVEQNLHVGSPATQLRNSDMLYSPSPMPLRPVTPFQGERT